jgi:hypothetical protein
MAEAAKQAMVVGSILWAMVQAVNSARERPGVGRETEEIIERLPEPHSMRAKNRLEDMPDRWRGDDFVDKVVPHLI